LFCHHGFATIQRPARCSWPGSLLGNRPESVEGEYGFGCNIGLAGHQLIGVINRFRLSAHSSTDIGHGILKDDITDRSIVSFSFNRIKSG